MKRGYVIAGLLAVITAFYFIGAMNNVSKKGTEPTETDKQKAADFFKKYEEDGKKREAKVPKFNKYKGTKIYFSDSTFTLLDARLYKRVYNPDNTYYEPKGVYFAVKLKVYNKSNSAIDINNCDFKLKLGRKEYDSTSFYIGEDINSVSPDFSSTFTLFFDVPKKVKKERSIKLFIDAFLTNGEEKTIRLK